MPCVLDPMGYQWNIGMGQERPVCLTLGALGRGPDYVDAGARCPRKRGILGRESLLEQLEVSFPSNRAVSVVDAPESTRNNPCLGRRGGR